MDSGIFTEKTYCIKHLNAAAFYFRTLPRRLQNLTAIIGGYILKNGLQLLGDISLPLCMQYIASSLNLYTVLTYAALEFFVLHFKNLLSQYPVNN